MDSGWHTYWQNPGASGLSTTIEWQLPPGVTAGAIQWPVPEKLLDPDLTTYIYQDDVVLLVPLKLAPDLPPGQLNIKARVSWLECQTECVPGRADVQAALMVGNDARISANASLLETWQKKLPAKSDSSAARAWWGKPEGSVPADLRSLLIEWSSATAASQADFFPDSSSDFEIQGPVERTPADTGKIRIEKKVKKLAGEWPRSISGLLVQQSSNERLAYTVNLNLETPGTTAPTGAASSSAESLPTISLWRGLLFGFLGGLILNVMPCVLPVIALKILGFVGEAHGDPRRTRRLGLIYGAGVVLSFLALAGLAIGLKAAGHKVGWGLQFSSPYFLVAMTILATLIALNLFGVFEVEIGGRTMDTAARLASRHGALGAFFNGLLATILATSCTAPILGSAVGFAFNPSQTAPTTLLVFLAIGLGLACPYVALTWQPAWLKFIPKPGAWMQRFKIVMGFPMLAAAVWLFSLAAWYYGQRSLWLAIFLVVVALAAWVYGEFIQRHRARPGLAWAAVLLILGTGYLVALEGHLRWREPLTQDSSSFAGEQEPNGIPWQPWSTAAVAQARAQGRPVVVDFTAKWCLTCNTIVKPALENEAVRKKLEQLNAAALLADYTTFSGAITEELNRHGRAGVPLVLVYPRDPADPPIVLPEVFTSATVLAALQRAAR
jgi:thiol:disulfide interchange protein